MSLDSELAGEIVGAAIDAVCEHLRAYEDSVADDSLWENHPEMDIHSSDLARDVAKLICENMALNLESADEAAMVLRNG